MTFTLAFSSGKAPARAVARRQGMSQHLFRAERKETLTHVDTLHVQMLVGAINLQRALMERD